MKTVGWVVLALVCFIHTMGQMGPFNCEVHSIQTTKTSASGKNLIYLQGRQNRLSRKKYNLLVDAMTQIDINDDFMANVNVAKKTPQGWKDNFFLMEAGPACSAINKYVPGFAKELAIGMKLKRHGCPFPRGNYTDIVVSPEWDIKGIPAFFFSSFRLRISVFNRTGVMGMFEVFIETTPKKHK